MHACMHAFMCTGGAFGAVGDRWGRYGVIHETDMWKKRPEFTLWLLEVKDINIEALSNWVSQRTPVRTPQMHA